MGLKPLLKQLYNALPLKGPVFKTLRTIWTPGFYEHLKFDGPFSVKMDEGRSFRINHRRDLHVENELFWRGLFGGWERVSLQHWALLAADADVVLDIGANTGVYALLAQAVKPDAHVVAFEPIDDTIKLLKANIRLNDFPIQVEPVALSDKTGEAEMLFFPEEINYMASLVTDRPPPKGKKTGIRTIRTQRLDDYIEEKGLDKIDLVKIDVEGHEIELLEGMGKYIEQFQPAFIIEILNPNRAAKTQAFFEGLDYVYFLMNEAGGKAVLKKQIEEFSHYNYLICPRAKAKAAGLPVD